MTAKNLLWILSILLLGANNLPGQCLRDAVIQDYQEHFLSSQTTITELNWTGSVLDTVCNPGSISQLAFDHTLERINYYRRLVGLPGNVIWDDQMSLKAQHAAVMMLANNDLSHDPPESWKCWTQEGYDAARKSNLAYGTQSSESIRAYIQDNGSNNGAVGHRRWILYSRAKAFGMGSTNSTQALWVIGPTNPAPDVDFIAYPSPGFFPKPLVYGRWSFSKPNANFNHATIRMTDAFGVEIPLEILPIANGYGDNSVVWEPSIPFEWLSNAYDEPVNVLIEGVVVGGNPMDYAYTVQMVPVQGAQQCHPGLILETADCHCYSDQLSARAEWETSLQIYPNPFTETITVSGPKEGTPVDVLSMDGQLLLRRQLTTTQLDLQLLPTGIYFLRIYGEHSTQVVKLLKTAGR